MDVMAAYYADQIRRTLSDGPCHLAGWSTGGIFAYEVARQLTQQGLTVGSLAFFDTPTPAIFQNVDLDDDARFLYDLVNFSNWFANAQMQVSYASLRELDPEEALRVVLEQAKEHDVLPVSATVPYLRQRIDACKDHVRAIRAYQPLAFEQSVTLFKPTDSTALTKASGQELAWDLGWGSILGDQLTIVEAPGDHFSMMTGDDVGRLSDQLQACLHAG
jgi:myxalamid-type polyketide synthase MxaB